MISSIKAVQTAGRKMANISSGSGSLVSGRFDGQTRSGMDRLKDMSMLA